MSTMSHVPDSIDAAALELGEAFEALFGQGLMRERPRQCSTCQAELDETKSIYIVDSLPIARSYRIVDAYDAGACVPERFADHRILFDQGRWVAIDVRTGSVIDTHPLAVRALDPLDEAI